MAATYYDLVDFFPPVDTDEAGKLLVVLQQGVAAPDLFHLAACVPADLASELVDIKLQDAFSTSLRAQAQLVLGQIQPDDPGNPTPEEELRILNGYTNLYAPWPDAKQSALRHIVQQRASSKKVTEPYWIVEAVATMTLNEARGHMDADFHEALARYYMVMAGRYIARDLKQYSVTGHVTDMEGDPMPGVRVQLEDANVKVPRHSGAAFTNGQGYFRSSFSSMAKGMTEYEVKAAFNHPRLNTTAYGTIIYAAEVPGNIQEFALAFEPVPSSSKTVASTGTAIPSDVQDYLNAQGITVTHLEDIRRLGGFINIPSKRIEKSNPDLLKLDGLASLELANPNGTRNSTLYDRGYTSISRIANTPRKDFVRVNQSVLGEFTSAQIHYRARAAHLYALNTLAGELTAVPAGESPSGAPIGPATGCGCADCASSVSPLAYLADLLCFTLDNLHVAPLTRITLNYLKANFFQDIGALPAGCTALSTSMCQNRIAAEILRKYYATAAISGTRTEQQQTDFAAAERAYLVNTYELLLNKLGTSYQEIRRMRGVNDGIERKRISDRLGVALQNGTADDTLAQLFIDLSVPANPSEADLESLFGHRRTTPFTLAPTPESKVAQWREARLREIWREQDALQNNFWNHGQVILDPDIVTVDDIRAPRTGQALFNLWDKRRSWIDTEMEALNGETAPGNATDAFQSSRIIVAYGREYIAPGPAPAITYSTSAPAPFSRTFTVLDQVFMNGNTYYKVEEDVPQDMANGTLAITGATPASHSNAGLPVRSGEAMIERLRSNATTPYTGAAIAPGWPEAGAPALIATLRQSLAEAAQGIPDGLARIVERGFTMAGATRLLNLYDKHQLAPLDFNTNGNLTGDEWQEFAGILVAVLKGRASEAGAIWRSEESTIQLGPDLFWPSIAEPRAGRWPFDRTVPLLDPDLVGVNEVPEVTARKENPVVPPGTTSIDVLAARRQALADARADLLDAHGTGFQQLLDLAFNSPGLAWDAANPANNDYLRLLNRLSDLLWQDWAQAFMADRLHLEADELRAIITLGTNEHNGTAVTDGDRGFVYAALLRAHKLIVLYPGWVAAESGVRDHVLRKGRLPRWRASAELRQAWLAALAENSAPPIIDADLLGPGDLRSHAGNRAFTLWKQRWVEMHGPYTGYPDDGNTGWLHEVDTSSLISTTAFDTLTKAQLGHAEESLADIREQQENGIDIRPRLAQLQLTIGEFAQLLPLRDILPVPPQPADDILTGEEKTTIKRILAQVRKRREAFTYRLEEAAPADPAPVVTLSPDFFLLPEVQEVAFPPAPPEHPLIPGLAEERDLIAWRRTLSGRIEQEKSVAKAWEEVLFDVDDAMMVHLRDALTQLCGAPGKPLVENARAIGDKLLVDLENNCCYKTNRVAAAIETLQQLLWKTRTGDILADYPGMEYRGEDFDEAWTWMGSYANWRAAMFVFLYPENVLAPSLRRQQTPAFRAVVEATRSNRRFGPDDACQVARDYRDYLVDVADLEVKCAAEAEVFVRSTGCGTQSTEKPRLLFTFAQGRTSHNAYYCTVDARDKTDITQDSFWQRIPALDETARIFGSTVYFPPDDGEFIYVFFTRTGNGNEDKFFALRFNLLNGIWEEEPLEFQVELDDLIIEWQNPASQYRDFRKEDFSPVIKAVCLRHCTGPWTLPTVAISLEKTGGVSKDVYTFFWSMHQNGTEFKPRWQGDGWRLYIEGDRVLKGLVRAFVGIWVDERSSMLDHSLFVLRTERSTSVTSAWASWNDGLGTLQNIASMDLSPFSMITFQGHEFPFFAIGLFIHSWVQDEPLPKYETVEFTPTDYIAYHQIFGGSTGGDTIYFPPQYNSDAGKEIRFLLPFYDRSTVHLEFDQNGDRWQDVVTYSTADPNVPIVTRNEPLLASAFPEGRNIVAPVRDQRFFDPGSPDFEAHGGLLLHQESGSGTRIGLSWHGKAFNGNAPELSTMQVTSAATVLTPGLSSVPVIQSEFTAAELDVRRSTSQYDLAQNADPNFRLAEYVHEAYYFVPVQIAQQLAANGYHQAALDWYRTIYDVSRPPNARKIYYGLVLDTVGTASGLLASDWYSDPLNPHAIAAVRPYAYTRYTMLAIGQCMMSYADAQFTMDTSETVPRARELYEDAIALFGMLTSSVACPADQAVQQLEYANELGAWRSTFHATFEELDPLSRFPGFDALVGAITGVLASTSPMEARLADVQGLIAAAQASVPVRTFGQVMVAGRAEVDAYAAAALGSLEAESTAAALGDVSGRTFGGVVQEVTGLRETELATARMPWLIDDAAPLEESRAHQVDRVDVGRTGTLIDHYDQHPASGLSLNSPYPNIRFSGLSFTFCTVPNPIVKALRLSAEVQLWKVHNCMNIAGMVRELDPFAAPTDSSTGMPVIGAGGGTLSVPTDRQLPPSAYRYRVLADRAKQLTAMAQQVESAFLATLEKLDAERYSLLRAEQDIESTKAQVKLQDLRMTEANDGVKLAELQRERAVITFDHYEELLDRGNSALEIAAFAALSASAALQFTTAGLYASAAALDAAKGPVFGNPFQQLAGAMNAFSQASSTTSNLLQLFASFERRKEEWEFQKSLATQDVKIADQGIKLAQDRVNITGQERTIAALQNDHARATLDFLKNKFTSAELYEWMSGILQDVYAYFLQAATGMALLAQRQLSFERQLDLPPFIRTDYWVVDAGSMGGVSLTGEGAVDRRGITGSTRLLRDLTELDQYAFSTNTPKLQMSKTISLSEIAPEEFIRLRDQGVMAFRTTHDLFDRDYPGHYLRLIKKVNVTVIALNPPTKGIRATLTNGGVSRVITGGAIFQERVINRLPEQIALSGGVSDYGVFQLRGEGEFLDPFEGTGVDTQWEFRMEKAANPFDYNSIADVLVTFEYEALNSFTYRQTVVQRLSNEPPTAGLAISFKNNLPDQWFDLHNPEQAAARYAATFQVGPGDLAPHLQQPRTIDHVAVYFVMKDGELFDQLVTLGIGDARNNEAVPNENLISTRGNAQGFTGLQGLAGPEGMWTFKLADSARTALLLAEKKVDDILLVITYRGETTPYSD